MLGARGRVSSTKSLEGEIAGGRGIPFHIEPLWDEALAEVGGEVDEILRDRAGDRRRLRQGIQMLLERPGGLLAGAAEVGPFRGEDHGSCALIEGAQKSFILEQRSDELLLRLELPGDHRGVGHWHRVGHQNDGKRRAESVHDEAARSLEILSLAH